MSQSISRRRKRPIASQTQSRFRIVSSSHKVTKNVRRWLNLIPFYLPDRHRHLYTQLISEKRKCRFLFNISQYLEVSTLFYASQQNSEKSVIFVATQNEAVKTSLEQHPDRNEGYFLCFSDFSSLKQDMFSFLAF